MYIYICIYINSHKKLKARNKCRVKTLNIKQILLK